MNERLTSRDKTRILEEIGKKYRSVAKDPRGVFKYPTGRDGLTALRYRVDLLQALPDDVAASYCGVGNPFSLGPIQPGEKVLDVGCGAGVDALLAAKMVGTSGHVIGVDAVPEMLAKARQHLEKTGLQNVIFVEASAEQLPLPEESFEVVISNGAINLVPDKLGSLREMRRALKPGGRLMIADQILVGRLPDDKEARISAWAR